MNDIAVFTPNHTISYTAIVISISILTAVVCAVLTAASMKKSVTAVLMCAAISVVIAPLCSRAIYWYCVPEQFDSILGMFEGMDTGGYCLPGVIVGVMLSAVVTWQLYPADGLLSLLDCLAPAAAVGIGTGRLAGFFSNNDKGNLVFTDEAWQLFPLSVPVTDRVTGVVEWRFASFLWESLAGYTIFVMLIIFIIRKIAGGIEIKNGDVFMRFFGMFGATQATLESTRYDALYMRSNGFISMMQMFSLVMILVPVVFYTVEYFRGKAASFKGVVPVLAVWGADILLIGIAGVSEYFIQRKSGYALWLYPVQMLALIAVCITTFVMAKRIRGRDELNARMRVDRSKNATPC